LEEGYLAYSNWRAKVCFLFLYQIFQYVKYCGCCQTPDAAIFAPPIGTKGFTRPAAAPNTVQDFVHGAMK
jgi:hypothetical protein